MLKIIKIKFINHAKRDQRCQGIPQENDGRQAAQEGRRGGQEETRELLREDSDCQEQPVRYQVQAENQELSVHLQDPQQGDRPEDAQEPPLWNQEDRDQEVLQENQEIISPSFTNFIHFIFNLFISNDFSVLS